MSAIEISLLVTTLLCSLVAGFLFAFAVVVMPGIRSLDDRAFLRAFQEMDGVIQKNDPLFVGVWVGSMVGVIICAGFILGDLPMIEQALMIAATVIYLFGVQLPTFIINIPLNNALQRLKIEEADDATIRAEREAFEAKWNRSNVVRAILAVVTSALLIVLLFRI